MAANSLYTGIYNMYLKTYLICLSEYRKELHIQGMIHIAPGD